MLSCVLIALTGPGTCSYVISINSMASFVIPSTLLDDSRAALIFA